MEIVHVAMEMADVAKVGGLGDVVLGLPLEFKRKGHNVKIILPKHQSINTKNIQNLKKIATVEAVFRKKTYQNSIYHGKVHGLDVYFVEDHTLFHLFNRKQIYGYKDDAMRFMYFCQVVIAFFTQKKWKIDILNLHDWHTALLAHTYKKAFPQAKTKIILTVHNFAYQGLLDAFDFHHCDINEIPKAFIDHKTKSRFNLLKGGLLLADYVTTVSPNFAKEALKKVVDGRGLEKVVRQVKHHYCGILNGIDYAIWDAKKDPHLKNCPIKTKHKITKKTFKGWSRCKITNKVDLQKFTKLTQTPKTPIIACITRLVPQKSPQLIRHAIQYTLKKGGQFVLLGSSANKATKKAFEHLKKEYKDNPNCHIHLSHSEPLAHKIFAGADFFIVPSKFEPCGITQMIALNFGTIPIVRKTGGLADTVFDLNDKTKSMHLRNGFVFEAASKKQMAHVIDRAFYNYHKHPELIDQLRLNGLNSHYDWSKSANEYLKVYRKAMQKKKTTHKIKRKVKSKRVLKKTKSKKAIHRPHH